MYSKEVCSIYKRTVQCTELARTKLPRATRRLYLYTSPHTRECFWKFQESCGTQVLCIESLVGFTYL